MASTGKDATRFSLHWQEAANLLYLVGTRPEVCPATTTKKGNYVRSLSRRRGMHLCEFNPQARGHSS